MISSKSGEGTSGFDGPFGGHALDYAALAEQLDEELEGLIALHAQAAEGDGQLEDGIGGHLDARLGHYLFAAFERGLRVALGRTSHFHHPAFGLEEYQAQAIHLGKAVADRPPRASKRTNNRSRSKPKYRSVTRPSVAMAMAPRAAWQTYRPALSHSK